MMSNYIRNIAKNLKIDTREMYVKSNLITYYAITIDFYILVRRFGQN